MTFEPTHDLQVVRSILTEPGVWPYIGDDFSGDPADFQPNADPRILYVLVFDGSRVLGLFLFLPQSYVCWEVHVAMLRGVSPALTHQAGREIIPWIWATTTCRRIVASVPAVNRAAVRYGVRAMGLEKFGVNERSFMKNGRLVDQIMLGISRPKENE